MTASDLERRIDRLEARAEIAELCSAYCIACDDHDLDRLRGLFTDDVRIRSLDGKMDTQGADDAIEMFNRMFSIRGPSYHWTHDRFVYFDDRDPDSATGQLLAHAETTPNETVSIAALRYEDRYRRIDGRWKFTERVLSFLYYMPISAFIDHFGTEKRIAVHGSWQTADYPEKLDCWKRWQTENAG